MNMVLPVGLAIHNIATAYTSSFNDLSVFHLQMKRKASRVPRCLFGASNPLDTEKLIQEQFDYDRERLLRRFDFDIVENDDELDANGHLGTHNLKNAVVGVEESRIAGSFERLHHDTATTLEDRMSEDELEERCSTDSSTASDPWSAGSRRSRPSEDASLHQKHSQSIYKKQSYLTDFWRTKRRSWNNCSKKSAFAPTTPPRNTEKLH